MDTQHELAKWRSANGLSQRELGGRVGVTELTVSRWERRTRRPNDRRTRALMDLTGLPLDAIRPDLAPINAPAAQPEGDTAPRAGASSLHPNPENSSQPQRGPSQTNAIGAAAIENGNASKSLPEGGQLGGDNLTGRNDDATDQASGSVDECECEAGSGQRSAAA